MKRLILVFAVVIAALGSSACGQDEGPAVKEARKLAKSMDDVRQAGDIVNASVAQQTPCGRVARHAFDPHTGKARVWTHRKADGNLECFNTAGFHRTARNMLMQITSLEVDEILDNPGHYPAYKPVTPVPPAPVMQPLVVATPLPQLSEGPCCGR